MQQLAGAVAGTRGGNFLSEIPGEFIDVKKKEIRSMTTKGWRSPQRSLLRFFDILES